MKPSIPQLIIDTDPGQDDCAAILFAMGLEKLGLLKIIAITTVAGNVPLALTQKNARIICDWGHRQELPVFAGATVPLLKKPISAEAVHGENGLAGVKLHDPITPLQETHAIEYLANTLRNATAKSITICAIGPLTNIALSIKAFPDCVQGIKEIVLMGGAYLTIGNITPNAEFNFFADPSAAQIVLNSNIPLKILPLDVTHKACITTPRMERLRQLPNQNGTRIADILQSYQRYDIQLFGLEGGPLHDPCAIACIVQPDLFSGKAVYAQVETNQCSMEGVVQVDWYSQSGLPANAIWFYDINATDFFNLFTEAIANLP